MQKILLAAAFIICLSNSLVQAQNIDVKLLDAINSPRALPADHYNQFLSNSFFVVVGGVPVIIGSYGLLTHNSDYVSDAFTIGGAAFIAGCTTMAIKYSVNRKRPFETYSFIKNKSDVSDPSFPSGHTSLCFSTATSLSICYPKWYVIVPAYAWASSVAYSRMYLGVHYPSDVLAGAVLGSASAWLIYKANNWFKDYYNTKHAKQQ